MMSSGGCLPCAAAPAPIDVAEALECDLLELPKRNRVDVEVEEMV